MGNKVPHKKEKYFFDLHIFDDEGRSRGPETPPVYTQEDIDKARKDAFHDGKTAGLRESAESREALVTNVLQKISRDMNTLFQAEKKREDIFEKEAVGLCLAIFRKIFPFYAERTGFEELTRALKDSLEKQKGIGQIKISVSKGMYEDIKQKLHDMNLGDPAFYTVGVDAGLDDGAFVLSWADGGAVRNTKSLAADVESLLKQTLAGKDSKVHDGDNVAEAAREQSGEPDE